MNDLINDVVDFLRGERLAFHYKADWLARAIWKQSVHNKMWSQASLNEWEAAIDEAIKRGLIESRNGKLGVVLKIDNEPKPQQMGLFDDVL